MTISTAPIEITRRTAIVAGLFLSLPAFNTVAGALAPKPELWAVWEAHDPNATAVIDHSAWTAYLAIIVTPDAQGVNRVDYGGAAMANRAELDAYIADLVALPISQYNRGEQEAYWVNLYNALTLQVVLDHYPVKSIQDIDISPGFFASGPWDKELVEIEGRGVTLNDIKHRILRPIWQDPRVHYVVNCASIGCPNLLPVAVTAPRVMSPAVVAGRTSSFCAPASMAGLNLSASGHTRALPAEVVLVRFKAWPETSKVSQSTRASEPSNSSALLTLPEVFQAAPSKVPSKSLGEAS